MSQPSFFLFKCVVFRVKVDSKDPKTWLNPHPFCPKSLVCALVWLCFTVHFCSILRLLVGCSHITFFLTFVFRFRHRSQSFFSLLYVFFLIRFLALFRHCNFHPTDRMLFKLSPFLFFGIYSKIIHLRYAFCPCICFRNFFCFYRFSELNFYVFLRFLS